MTIWDRSEVQSIPGAGCLGVGGVIVLMGLYILAQSEATMFGVIQRGAMHNLARAVMPGNTVLCREIIHFASTLHNQCLHNWLGKGLVWQSVIGSAYALLDNSVVPFGFRNMGLGFQQAQGPCS